MSKDIKYRIEYHFCHNISLSNMLYIGERSTKNDFMEFNFLAIF